MKLGQGALAEKGVQMKPMRASRPSPAIVIGVLALVSAVAGTAIAGPGATTSKLTKSKVAKIADTEINNLAPGLSVANAQNATNAQNAQNATNAENAQNATNALNAANAQNATNAQNAQNATTAQDANTVDGLSAADLLATSGFGENAAPIPSLSEGGMPVAGAAITTQGFGRVLASGSAELIGADAGERGACWIVIDGQASAHYESDPDDIGTNSKTVIAVNFARTLFEGSHTATLVCAAVGTGVVGMEDAAINVYGIPIPPS